MNTGILVPGLHLPADGKGSEELNLLVAQGKLIFEPSTGNFRVPVTQGATHKFPVQVNIQPSRRDDSIFRCRTSDRIPPGTRLY